MSEYRTEPEVVLPPLVGPASLPPTSLPAVPRPPRQPIGVANGWPPPPEQGADTPTAWAVYAADLFRGKADWRMSRAAATIAQALASAEAARLYAEGTP